LAGESGLNIEVILKNARKRFRLQQLREVAATAVQPDAPMSKSKGARRLRGGLPSVTAYACA